MFSVIAELSGIGLFQLIGIHTLIEGYNNNNESLRGQNRYEI